MTSGQIEVEPLDTSMGMETRDMSDSQVIPTIANEHTETVIFPLNGVQIQRDRDKWGFPKWYPDPEVKL